MITNDIQIKRHYRSHDGVKVHKNKALHDNATVIMSSDKLVCMNLLKFTINTIIGDQNQFEMVCSIIGQEISQDFKNYTYLLTGNNNKISWIARDVTRGAIIQLVLICCRLEQLNGYTNIPINHKLTSNEEKFNFVLNHIKLCDVARIKVLSNALYKSKHYLDECSLDFDSEICVHSLWHGYSITMSYRGKLQYSKHNRLFNLGLSSDCVKYNGHNYQMLLFSLETIKLRNYQYHIEANRFLSKSHDPIGSVLSVSVLSTGKSEIAGECILETKSYIISVTCHEDRFIENMTGKIFIKHEKKSYDYIVDTNGFIFYDVDSEYIGKSDYLINLEKNILELQTTTA